MSATYFRIPECNLPELEERMAKLGRRAKKHDLAMPAITVEHTDEVPLVRRVAGEKPHEWPGAKPGMRDRAGDELQIVGYRSYHIVRLEGEAPTIPGWTLVAVIEHGDTELGNVIRVAPGMECPPVYRKADALCQHCNMVRRRAETFVLRDDAGAYKQVGRNCLADFCRNADFAEQLCAYAQMIASIRGLCEGAEDENFFGFGGRVVQRAPVESVLAATSRLIRHAGFVSRKAAREKAQHGECIGQATADVIVDVFFNPRFFERRDRDSNETRALQDAMKNIEDSDKELALKALEWIRAKRPESETLNDYLYNLLVVASEETALSKHFGILCSLIASYQREMGLAEEKKVKQPSAHIGKVGERGRWLATYVSSRAFEGQSYGYGDDAPVRWMHKFLANDKDTVIWWTGNETDLKAGEQIILVGSVKKHDEYKGHKQTVLTRCTIHPVERCGNCAGPILAKDKKCPACKAKVVRIVPQPSVGQVDSLAVGNDGSVVLYEFKQSGPAA